MTRSAASTDEAYIKDGQAAAFDASGAIVGTVQSFSTSTPTVNTTTRATRISVVANPGSTSICSIVNKTNLETVTTDLASTATSVTTKNKPRFQRNYQSMAILLSISVLNTSYPQSVDMYNLVGKMR